MKSHILYFSNHLRGPSGEAGTRSWHQVRALAENFEVDVVIPGIDPVSSKPVSSESYEGLDLSRVSIHCAKVTENVRTSKFARFLYYFSGMFHQIYFGMRFGRRSDVVVSMGMPVTTLFVAGVVSRVYRKPLVIDVRDMPFEMGIEIGYLNESWLIKLAMRIERRILKSADRVFTNSPKYIPFLQDKGVDFSKIELAMIGFDSFEDRDGNSGEDLSELAINFGSDVSSIGLYAGTIGHAFPVMDFLVALRDSKLSSLGLVIVGDGQLMKECENFVSANKLNVVFTGRMSKRNVKKYIDAVDFYIYPGRAGVYSSAILGNKVFDYMAGDKPIIYFGGLGAVSEVITDYYVGEVVTSSKIDDLVTCLKKFTSKDYRNSFNSGVAAIKNNNLLASAAAEKFTIAINKLRVR